MQKFLKYLLIPAFLLLAGVMTSCTNDPETTGGNGKTSFEVELKSVGAASAEVWVRSEGIARIAWVVSDTPVDRNIIFATGKTEEITSAEQAVVVGGLSPLKSFTVQFAAETTKDKFYEEVRSIELTTTDFSEEYTIFDIDYRSAKIHVKMPAEVSERGNVLKWGFADYALYNSGVSDAAKINMHDQGMGNYFTEDKLFVLDNTAENMFPGGEVDEDAVPYYEDIYPYQDCYFIIGEFSYVDEENMGYWITDEDGDEIYIDFTNGFHEPGYYRALFDEAAWRQAVGNQGSKPLSEWRATPLSTRALPDQSQFWSGYYRLINFKTKAPELLEGEVEVDLSQLRPNGGEIRMTPKGDGIAFYLVGLLHPNTWEEITTRCVSEPTPENIQAYLTSKHAAMSFAIEMFEGQAAMAVNSRITFPDSETDYVLVIIGMGNEEATAQFYQQQTFRLPASTLDIPTVEVELLDELTTSTSLSFRVKSPSQNAAGALYAMNLSREWDIMLNKYGYTVEEVVSGGGYFETEEMSKINSSEGYIVEFRGLTPGMKYGFGALCVNADAVSGEADFVEGTTLAREYQTQRVESPYFESLKGEWTLTATIAYKEYNSMTFEWTPTEDERKSRVVIGDITMPGLDAEDYDIASRNYYGAVSRDEMDSYYAEVEEALPAYHKSLRDRNYILCQGYDLAPWLYDRHFSTTDYSSPHDLLTDRYYSYYDAQTLLYEYGPKWYFEVGADGKLSVPFSAYEIDPNYGYEGPYYLAGVNSHSLKAASGDYSLLLAGIENGNWTIGHFPVTMVDENTIKIEPYVYEGEKYYAHLVMADLNGYGISARITSEIILTRGWDERNHPEYQEPKTTASRAGQTKMIPLNPGQNVKPTMRRPRSVTKFDHLMTE